MKDQKAPVNGKIEPCPFCGTATGMKVSSKTKRTIRNGLGDLAFYRTYYVRCFRCNARGPAIGGLCNCNEGTIVILGKEETVRSYSYYHEKAIEAWNCTAGKQ